MTGRSARLERVTRETSVTVALELEGSGATIDTSLPFLDHLLDQVARHGGFGLELHARGDVDVDAHHLSEDVGLAVGAALDEALGDRRGIERFGAATIPLDESLVEVAIDLSGRPGAWVELGGERALLLGRPGVAVEHVEELLAGFARAGRLTLHVRSLRGRNTHHQLEATAKALGRSLRAALERRGGTDVPSTKGRL